MISIESVVDGVEKYLRDSNPLVQYVFNKVQEKTGVKRAYVAVGFGIVFSLYMIFGYFAQLLCNLVGFLIPAYASMHAIESSGKDDDTKWLTYWVVFALFSVIDFFADVILRYFPFYWLAKIIFLVWCFFPAAENGSTIIYRRLVRPYFLKGKDKIDDTFNRAAKKTMETIDQTTANLTKRVLSGDDK